jgi:signal transduction histidine kinase
MKSQLIQTVESSKEFYERDEISKETLVKLFLDKYITIRFTDNIKDYNLDVDSLKMLDNGDSILFHKKIPRHLSFSFPMAIIKTKDSYIIGEISITGMGFDIKRMVMAANLLSLIIGSLLFLLAGKMFVKPISKLTQATESIADGDFDIEIKTNRKDEIGNLISSFNMMAGELKSIEILRNDFISDISHEFKTPLTSIEGYTKLLKDCSDEERSQYIDIITEETKRLSILSTNILTLNSIENENYPIYTEEFSLDEQIRKAILLLENKWIEKEIEWDIDLDSIKFKGNKNLMYQVWINLIDNAIKFSEIGGIIEIKLSDADNPILSIRDEGNGIDLEDNKKVFEKFYKADKSRNSDGNGLGLSIVKRIVHMHNGEITLESRVGEGTKVIVKL